MNHQQVCDFLDAYIDRELDVLTAVEFESHLTECNDCWSIFAQYEQLQASVQAQLPRFEAPRALQSKILGQLGSAEHVQYGTIRKE